MKTALPSVLLTLLPVLPAAALSVTPERPASPPTLVAAPFAQINASAASNGRDFLAIWFDGRSSHDAPNSPGPHEIYGTRIKADGTVNAPLGRRLAADAYSAQIASDGSEYLFTYSAAGGVFTQPLDDDGVPTSDPKLIVPGNVGAGALTSNGQTFLLVTYSGGSAVPKPLLLDHDGNVLEKISLNSADTTYAYGPAVGVAIGGTYHIIQSRWTCPGNVACTSGLYDDVVNVASATTVRHTLYGDIGQHYQLTAIASPDRLLVAWLADQTSGKQTLGYLVTDANDRTVASNDQAYAVSSYCGCGYASVSGGWDGAKFVLTFESGPPDQLKLLATRVTREGTQVDTTPLALSDSTDSAPAITSSATEQLIVWAEGPALDSDVVGRLLRSFDALVGSQTSTFAVTHASPAQQQANIAALGDGTVTVWRETGDGRSVRAAVQTSAGSTTIVLGPAEASAQHDASVAGAGDVALVAWTEDAAEGFRILARRVRPDGTSPDPKPVVIATDPGTGFSLVPEGPAVASDGTDFVVAWPGTDNEVHAVRVHHDGTVVDNSPITVSRHAYAFVGVPGSARIVWTGSVYLASWLLDPNPPGPIGRPPISAYSVKAARLTREGIVLDDHESLDYYSGGGAAAGLTLARLSDGVLIAWAGTTGSAPACIDTLTASFDGTLKRNTPEQAYCHLVLPARLESASAGDETVVVWSDLRTTASALELTADGRSRDGPFALTPAGSDAYDPSIIAIGNRFAIAYTRTADEGAYGGVGRVFTVFTTSPARSRGVRAQ